MHTASNDSDPPPWKGPMPPRWTLPVWMQWPGAAFQYTLPRGATFALAAVGLLLCAEPNHRLTLSRIKAGIWETFRTQPEPR